jgi:hypothetical protein
MAAAVEGHIDLVILFCAPREYAKGFLSSRFGVLAMSCNGFCISLAEASPITMIVATVTMSRNVDVR